MGEKMIERDGREDGREKDGRERKINWRTEGIWPSSYAEGDAASVKYRNRGVAPQSPVDSLQCRRACCKGL
jgi:hypothetical protein